MIDTLTADITQTGLDADASVSELADHMEGAVLDAILETVADLRTRELVEETLQLVNWGSVAQDNIDKLKGDGWHSLR